MRERVRERVREGGRKGRTERERRVVGGKEKGRRESKN